jgi:hypothetical protein
MGLLKGDTMFRAFAIASILGFALAVWAAPPGDAPSSAACGAVNVLNSAPTEIPCRTIVPSKIINSCLVQNLGANVIYCNFSNTDGGAYLLDGGLSTSVNWGLQIPANGGTYPFDMRLFQGATGTNAPVRLYCQAKTADQTTGETNTRFCGVR